MTTDDFHVEQELRDLYYDPKHGYGSEDRLFREATERGLGISRRQIRDWLQKQDTYTKFKASRKTGRYRRVFVKGLAIQLQMDLVDMKKFGEQNDDHWWILTAIEVLSRYAFAAPVLRKGTEHMTGAVEKVLGEFGRHFGSMPKEVQFDEGTEFYNVGVKELLDDHKIGHFSTRTDSKKASIVERFNRTLKTRMWKYLDAEGTREWMDVLDQFVAGYNESVNRSIKMKPKDVDDGNADVVFTTLYGYRNVDVQVPRFKIGDHVRVSRYKNTHAKGYEVSFTEELFTVSGVNRGDPNMYEIEDDRGESIRGRFYERELSLYEG